LKELSNFRGFIQDLIQKIQHAWIFVTCNESPFNDASHQFSILEMKGLKNEDWLKLIVHKLSKFKKYESTLTTLAIQNASTLSMKN